MGGWSKLESGSISLETAGIATAQWGYEDEDPPNRKTLRKMTNNHRN